MHGCGIHTALRHFRESSSAEKTCRDLEGHYSGMTPGENVPNSPVISLIRMLGLCLPKIPFSGFHQCNIVKRFPDIVLVELHSFLAYGTTALSGNDAQRSSAFKSSNTLQLTVVTVARRIRQKATESNIHCGISRSRPPGSHRRRTDTQLAHSWSELRGPPQCERAKGAKGNGLLAIQYYGCCVVDSYHEERNHQGKENLTLFPLKREGARDRKAAVRCRERLGGLLKYYEREAA